MKSTDRGGRILVANNNNKGFIFNDDMLKLYVSEKINFCDDTKNLSND